MTYTYDPTKIREYGKDQMRFELGDTLIDGGEETCALADEEYTGILKELTSGKRAWQSVKLYCLEAIMFKMSYQVDTKIDVVQYGLGKRAEHWQKLYTQIRAEILANTGAPTAEPSALRKPPYFHTDMNGNHRTILPRAQEYPGCMASSRVLECADGWCVPDGSVDLQNLTPGEIIKRAWSFRCNASPEMIEQFQGITGLQSDIYRQTYA